MDTRRRNEKKYIVLKKAARISGYSSDYLGFLIRKKRIKGKRVYTNVSWKVTPEEIVKYCKKANKAKSLDIRDLFLLKKKYLSLKEAAKLSGYASDYIGYLIRKGEIRGKQVHSGATWVTTEKAIRRYQEKIELKKKGFNKIILSSILFLRKAKRTIDNSWRFVFLMLILIFLIGLGPGNFFQKITGALVGVFSEESKTVELYATSCSGDWSNFQNVRGMPEAGPEGDLNFFSETNSAVYKGGSLTLVCQNFRTSVEQTIEDVYILPEVGEETVEEVVKEEQTVPIESKVEETEIKEQEEVLTEEELDEEEEIVDLETDREEINQEIQGDQEIQEEKQTKEEEQETTEEKLTEEEQVENQEEIKDSEIPEGLQQEEQSQQEQKSETSTEDFIEEIIEEEAEESSTLETQPEAENSEEPLSFFDKVKSFFGFSTTKAQQIPTFSELKQKQFRSARIKFSFAIGEKSAGLEIPIIQETELPNEQTQEAEQSTDDGEWIRNEEWVREEWVREDSPLDISGLQKELEQQE